MAQYLMCLCVLYFRKMSMQQNVADIKENIKDQKISQR